MIGIGYEGQEIEGLGMKVQRRRIGRPKTRWKDCVAADMKEHVYTTTRQGTQTTEDGSPKTPTQ